MVFVAFDGLNAAKIQRLFGSLPPTHVSPAIVDFPLRKRPSGLNQTRTGLALIVNCMPAAASCCLQQRGDPHVDRIFGVYADQTSRGPAALVSDALSHLPTGTVEEPAVTSAGIVPDTAEWQRSSNARSEAEETRGCSQ